MGLQIRDLCKDYASPVLRNLDLQVAAGEIHGIVGENGAGKSTLLKILSGLTLPGAGAIVLDGEPLLTKNPQAAHRAGISTACLVPVRSASLSPPTPRTSTQRRENICNEC